MASKKAIMNILNTKLPCPKRISPMALATPPGFPTVPEPNDLDRRLGYAIAPPHFGGADDACCTTLPPSPKTDLTNNPTCIKSRCFPNRPFKRDKCYILYSPAQNMWGPVCGSGGTNADWVRGNRFGVSYEKKKIYNSPTYAVDVPKFLKKNPVLVSDSPFYPFPDYGLRFNPKYKSYPYENNYIRGHPYTRFPYQVLNQNSGVEVKEGFQGGTQVATEKVLGIAYPIMILVILVLLVLFSSKLWRK